MNILIDYDNVLEPHRKPGTKLLIERIVDRLKTNGIDVGDRVHVRLYGGWYEGSTLSRRGQTLSGELFRDFPTTLKLQPSGKPVSLTAELALSLDIDPLTHFHHTFRKQSPPLDVRCEDPRFVGCSNASCPIIHVHSFLASGSCSISGCGRTVEEMLFRSSQKLVDSMLTVDLVTIATRNGDPIAIVSSDDDLWPGIHCVLQMGTPAIQIHTKPGAIARHPYVRPGRAGYTSLEM